MEKRSVTAVSYLNTKPFLYGLLQHPVREQLNLELDIPSEGARKLLNGESELGLVPVAILPELTGASIISDFCIGTEGTVKTVSIYSQVPIDQVERLWLDFHSRTSVELAKILLREYWRVSPVLESATPGYVDRLAPRDAALVIGDRTIGLSERFAYEYDLGASWKAMTGLPFVFAAWVSRSPLPKAFLQQFNEALSNGVAAIPELTYLIPSPDPSFDLQEYFTRYINYSLDTAKKKALQLFLGKVKAGTKLAFQEMESL